MTDRELVHAVEAALGSLSQFHRDVYALARLRVQRGEPLKATQRQQLMRVVRLARSARMTFTQEGGVHA